LGICKACTTIHRAAGFTLTQRQDIDPGPFAKGLVHRHQQITKGKHAQGDSKQFGHQPNVFGHSTHGRPSSMTLMKIPKKKTTATLAKVKAKRRFCFFCSGVTVQIPTQ